MALGGGRVRVAAAAAASLAVLARVIPERPAAVCRELTKRFEEVVRGTVAELAARFVEPPKGEVTLVVGRGAGGRRGRGRRGSTRSRSWSAAGLPRRQAADAGFRGSPE